MSENLKRWKSKIINEALALHRKHGDAAAPIVVATAEWSEEHPLDGDDARVPPFFKANADYGGPGSIQAALDEYRKKSMKKLKKRVYAHYAQDGRLGPIDSYCAKPKNKKYWTSAGSAPAVRDFLKYIDQVECE
jgi:hypothetical protein